MTVPATTAPGSYYVIACADDRRTVSESDETNNCGASASAFLVGWPDLVITAVGDPPPTVVRGTQITASDTVRNDGTVPGAATRVRYYLSVDGVKGTGDRLLSGTRSVPALAAGASATGSITVTVPRTTPTGDYWFFACSDDSRAVTEGSETNNCRAAAGRLSITP